VQEVFLKLYRLRGWDKIEDERAYLARMAWRAAVDHLPKTKGDRLALDAESPSRDESPEQAAVLGNWAAVVHQLMDALPEELRQPLALSAVDDLKSFEIAGMLGIPEGTVRTRIKKAREILKQKLWRLTGESYGRRHG
jgi:RNA polymerase sigma-70 factor (ECF subfamily)